MGAQCRVYTVFYVKTESRIAALSTLFYGDVLHN